MSDAEWALTEPTLPAPAWKQGKGGRPAGHCRRDVVDAIRYLVKEGICWRAMPADFPPWQTVYDVLDGWQESGATEALRSAVGCMARPFRSRGTPTPRASGNPRRPRRCGRVTLVQALNVRPARYPPGSGCS
jgi:hypothetical protein